MKKYIINIKNFCFLVCLIISMSINSQTIRTVGTAGNYASLTAAFTAINSGTITGAIELQIISSYTVTTTATLNASGSGSASYTSISIYPTGVGGYSIQHNIAGNGIVLSGADNVTFDGRVNRTGSTRSLTIANTNTGTSACVIRFLNSAENNIIRWCNIRGAGPNASAGMITFGTSTAGNGNDGNTIDNCDITTSATTLLTRPRSAIYSLGSSGFSNDNITVSNCNIYNFHCNLASASVSTGIYVASFSSTWTISGNSFYETTVGGWVGTPFSNVVCIQIGTSTTGVGSGYTITNNFMGGSSASCVGTWGISATAGSTGSNSHFIGIYIRTTSSGVTNSIQGNTIKNVNISTLQANTFRGVYVVSGNDFNIGNITGNTVQSITIQGRSSNPSTTCGFDFGTTSSAFGNISIENNTIIDIPATSSTNVSSSVYGIRFAGTSNTFLDLNINNNSIGGTSGLYSTSAGTSTSQVVAGIYLFSVSDGNYNTTISGNTIWNLQNSASNISSSQTHMICGIYSNCRLTTGTNLITRNFIRSLIPGSIRVDTRGITTANINSGNATYSNNIISIGTGITVDSPMSGLWVSPGTASQPNKVYHNTVYIGGGSTSNTVNPTYAIYSYNINTATGNDVRNNIGVNARSGQASSASKHYAIRFASGSFSTTYTANYNDYFVSGTNGVFGQWGFLDVTSLASWKTSTGQEANTINTNPTFASAGGTLPANYLPSATVNGLSGISGAPTIDHFQNTRPSTPKMGALESSCNPPNGTVAFGAFTSVGSSSITVNTTFTNGTNLANGYVLLRNTTNTAPTAPTSGTAVPSAGDTSFVSGYTVVGTTTTLGSSVAFVSSGLASGTTYYYWVIPYQNTGGPCWYTPTTQNSNSQATSASGLPIELVSFTVTCVGNNDRLFEWKTASEYNNSYFTIESSKDFVNWNTIHGQSGAGNSTQLINYTLIKKSPYSSGVEYWRLRQTDFDGTSKITGSISIECRSDEYLVYFVNPIEDETIKGTIQSLVDSDATIEIFTEIGQLVSKKELNIKAGANFVSIDYLDLSSAMYFVILTIGDSVFKHKVIVIN